MIMLAAIKLQKMKNQWTNLICNHCLKNAHESRTKGTLLSLYKNIKKAVCPKTKKAWLLSPVLLNMVLKVQAYAIKQENTLKTHRLRGRDKLSLGNCPCRECQRSHKTPRTDKPIYQCLGAHK